MSPVVHVWSDVVCPWCFIGKRRLEAALRRFGEPVEVVYHSFELDPGRSAEKLRGLDEAERLAKKYGMPVERARQMQSNMQATGAKDGIEFRPEGGRTLQSFDAHRLLHFAKEHGKQVELKERIFEAQWVEGVDCGEASELVRLAESVGLDPDRAMAVLASDQFAAEVREDEEAARQLGITGVPFFVIGRYGVSGAQSADVLLAALDRAHLDQPEEAVEEGAICEPGVC